MRKARNLILIITIANSVVLIGLIYLVFANRWATDRSLRALTEDNQRLRIELQASSQHGN